MKQYLQGGIVGYLLTSIFDIPAPPEMFWWFLVLLGAIASYLYFVVYQMNNDSYGDVDE